MSISEYIILININCDLFFENSEVFILEANEVIKDIMTLIEVVM